MPKVKQIEVRGMQAAGYAPEGLAPLDWSGDDDHAVRLVLVGEVEERGRRMEVYASRPAAHYAPDPTLPWCWHLVWLGGDRTGTNALLGQSVGFG